MRITSRPPTGHCNLPEYMGFLMSEPKSISCTRLAEVMGFSHDSVNRFLLRENYQPQDLFNEAQTLLNLSGGTLSVDDTVLDKPYSQQMDLVSHVYSGKHHRVVKGINVISLYYTDVQGRHLPVNYRIYVKSENKTKNDYFQEMLAETLTWGLKPAFITGDSWYGCNPNLKWVRNHPLGFMFAVESNRCVSLEKGTWVQVQRLVVPEQGQIVWLREFGWVKLFRTWLKDQPRHYVVYLPDSHLLEAFSKDEFVKRHQEHWQIEQYHRMIKQVCHIEKFQVRKETAIRNHLFAAFCAYVQLQRMSVTKLIVNAYQMQQDLFSDVIADFIRSFVVGQEHLYPQFRPVVNA